VDKRRIWVFIGIALVVIVGLEVWRRMQEPPVPGPDVIPAASVPSSQALALGLQVEPQEGGRRLRLRTKDGEAWLTLKSPGAGAAQGPEAQGPEAQGPFRFGKAILEAPDRVRGAAFVAAVARWLGVSAGRVRQPPGPLEPVPLSYVALGQGQGEGRRWEVYKLFLESGSEPAEVFLRIATDGRAAELVEKDPEYRASLVESLAAALRDGPEPVRSPQNDPNLESSEPLIPKLHPLAGAPPKTRPGVWMRKQYLASAEDPRGSVLLRWADPGQPPERLAVVEGWVTSILPSPARERIAFAVTTPREPGRISSDDPSAIWLLALGGGQPAKLAASSPDFHFALSPSMVFSPKGDRLAVGALNKSGRRPPFPDVVRVCDVTDARVVAAIEGEGAGAPEAWDAQGIRFAKLHFGQEIRREHFQWVPGQKPRRVEVPVLRTPDGRFLLAALRGDLTVKDPAGGVRILTSSRKADRQAIEALEGSSPQWLAGRLLLQSDDLLAVDLGTLKARLVLPPRPRLRVVAVGGEGRRIMAEDPERRFWWGEVPGRR
jgi:hypothetical protein